MVWVSNLGHTMFKRWSNSFYSTDRRRQSRQRTPIFQQLEDRRLLATFTVTNIGDGPVAAAGDLSGSLRQAVFDANANPGADTIEFDSTVFTGGNASLIRLTNGELEITESLTISAQSSLGVTITGDANGDDITLPGNITDVSASFGGAAGAADDLLDDNSRVLNFSGSTGDLTLEGLTITGGRTTGDNTGFSVTTYSGGGIRSVRNVNLSNSTVSGNSSAGIGADGGGIFSSGFLTLTNSMVNGNSTAGQSADGGGIAVRGSVKLAESTVSGNTTKGRFADGGGVYGRAGVTVIDSTVSGNATTGQFADGGGVSTDRGAVTLTSSTVSGNTTGGDGGGIDADFFVQLTNSTLAGNTASGAGGGILLYAGDVILTNSTVSGNTTSGVNGAGIHVYYPAAMAIVPNNTLTLHNSIVTGNFGDGGEFNDFDLFVENSIIDGDFTTILETEVVNGVTVPLLTDNGGPVETIALLAGSPAIDAGDNALAVDASGSPLLNDQRGLGFDRIFGSTVDIGAFELAASPFLLGDTNQDGIVNFADIPSFISILQNGTFLDEADINGDGVVNFGDISFFIDLLLNQ